MVMAELVTMGRLARHLDREGLEQVRTRLKASDMVAAMRQGGELAEIRAEILDAVCGLLCDLTGTPEAYYIGCGDMFPKAPDTFDFGGPDVR